MTTLEAQEMTPTHGRTEWKSGVSPFERASTKAAVLDLVTSLGAYVVLTIAMYLSREVSIWLTLALAIPASGFLLRTFIVFHDCAHGSFLPTKAANRWVGRITGLVVFQPYANWGHTHAIHHAGPVTSIVAGPATWRRSPSPSTSRAPGAASSPTDCFAARW